MLKSFVFAIGLLGLSSGCQMLKWVEPHQLYKLNRQPSMARDDAYFNVPAQPVPEGAKSAQNSRYSRPF